MGHILLRIAITGIFAAYLGVIEFLGPHALPVPLIVLVSLYLCYALVWIVVLQREILNFKSRLVTATVLDQLMVACALYTGGDIVAPIFWTPVSAAVGCGLLGGMFYAKFSSIVGGLFTGFAVALSPAWTGMPEVALGIVLGTVVIPWHVALLSERIESGRRAMRRRAAAFEAAAHTDSLTGTLNRDGFARVLRRLLDDTRSGATRGALMLLDLDGFKAVNDTAGHAAGDALLKEVARQLRNVLRISDQVGRIGGDEFGILLRDLSGEEDACRLADKVLQAIEAARVPAAAHMRITGSIGVCVLQGEESGSLETVMEVADRLMYEAKKSGKNRYRILADMTPSIVVAA